MIGFVVVGLLGIGFIASRKTKDFSTYRQTYKLYGAIYLFILVGFFFAIAAVLEIIGFKIF